MEICDLDLTHFEYNYIMEEIDYVEIAICFLILMPKQMDRCWVHLNPFTPAYMDGVEEFMEFVRWKCLEESKIKCRCRRCVNQVLRHQHEVNDHIHIFGMSPAYTRWINHGQSPSAEIIEYREEDVHHERYDCDEEINLGEDDGKDDGQDDDHGVKEMLADLYTSLEADGGNPRFTKVLNDAKQQLCPGSKHSKFSLLVRLLYIKSRYRVGSTTFNALMKLLSQEFPQCELPSSYDEAKYLGELGLAYESIHVCKNNCVLFKKSKLFDKDYSKLEVCLVCGESRWEDGDGKRRVARKVLRHFPLIKRLKMTFAMKEIAEYTKWHKKGRKPEKNVMIHPAMGGLGRIFIRSIKNLQRIRET
jgi:hypothetical protein